MSSSPSLSQASPDSGRRQQRLTRAREVYSYKTEAENQLWPISIAGSYPFFKEWYAPSWLWPMGRKWALAWARRQLLLLRFGFQKATFRYDKMAAYDLAFPGREPAFGGMAERDEAFAYWRIAGPNALGLQQERNLRKLRARIPFDTGRIEERLRTRLGADFSLVEQAEAGRLFSVDFSLVQSALRPDEMRDSRWREKYLPAPIGVFLEAPGFYDDERAVLVPLAVQIDQPQPQLPNGGADHNPVYYPDQGWAWRIAKLYFEAADVSYHVACGHVFRTHLVVEPFCVATPRQLSEEHPVFILLRPHTRFTLPTNKAAYKYFVDPRDTYAEFYAGTLEETRNIAIQSYLDRSFRELELERELESRNVAAAPEQYPYRDDARLWIEPLRRFVSSYIEAFYGADSDVAGDEELQQWARELTSDDGGRVKDLVPGDRLDTRGALIAVLTQVLFTAGPGHASQHFSSNHYYRYAPAFPGAAYAPPPWQDESEHRARFRNTLPPIGTASNQVRYNTFTNLKYDRFGSYRRYPLGRVPEAREPIARLRCDLERVEQEIRERNEQRLLPFEFLLPSKVPNSANI